MPRHLQLVKALAVCFLAVGARQCTATIVFKTGSRQYSQLADMPASFGPGIKTNGVGDPAEACTPLRTPKSVAGQRWIALISRNHVPKTNCTFDLKVGNAERAGAAAAIVYDNVEGPLVIMAKPAGHPEPGIPAVFVSRKSGEAMLSLLTPGVTIAVIMPAGVEVWLPLLMSAFSALIAIIILVATLYAMRYLRLRRLAHGGALVTNLLQPEGEGGMSAEELRALPLVIHETPHSRHPHHHQLSGSTATLDAASSDRVAADGRSDGNKSRLPLNEDVEAEGATRLLPPATPSNSSLSTLSSSSSSPRGAKGGGTLKLCVVCIEDYRDGDKLRVLPCNHRFHKDCIDQWLSARPPLCPVCKWDAAQPFPNTPQAEAAAAAAEEAALNSSGFLLRSWRRWFTRRRRRDRGRSPSAAAATNASAVAAVHRHDIEAGLPGQTSQGLLESQHTPRNFPALLGVSVEAARNDNAGVGSNGNRSIDRPEITAAQPIAPSAVALPSGPNRSTSLP